MGGMVECKELYPIVIGVRLGLIAHYYAAGIFIGALHILYSLI
jgi:hypothetical protein